MHAARTGVLLEFTHADFFVVVVIDENFVVKIDIEDQRRNYMMSGTSSCIRFAVPINQADRDRWLYSVCTVVCACLTDDLL